MAMNSVKSGKKVHFQEAAIPNKQREVTGGGEFERFAVYVANVDYWCTTEDLKNHFECCGTVNRITIPTNQFGNPRGYAYVEFSDIDNVDKALGLSGSMLRYREITVSRKRKSQKWNPNNTNRGFRLPLEQQPPSNSRSVSSNFNRSSIPPYAITNNNRGIQQQPSSSSTNSRFNHVRPATGTTNTTTGNDENTNCSIQEEGIPIKQGGAIIAGEPEAFDRYSIYVDNVDYWCTAEDLKTHFDSCGTVNRITIPTNEFGNPQGYAYVEFSDLGSVDKALLLNGSILRSREISVSRKRQRAKWNRNNNNASRAFRRPTQQQPPANSRSVGAISSRTSRPPYPNKNNNRANQQQPQTSSSNSSSRYLPLMRITNTDVADHTESTNDDIQAVADHTESSNDDFQAA